MFIYYGEHNEKWACIRLRVKSVLRTLSFVRDRQAPGMNQLQFDSHMYTTQIGPGKG